MNLESESPMSRAPVEPGVASQPVELDRLLIDAEADDDLVQQQPPVLRRPWLLLLGLVLRCK